MISPSRAVAIAAPWLAPMGTAWVVLASLAGWQVWPMHVIPAVAVALAIECNGFTSIDLLLTLIRYNDTRRKSDPIAPTGWAWAVLGVYLASVLALTIMIEVIPQAGMWRAVVFPVMSLAAFAVPVLRSKHERTLREVAEAKEEARKLRQERKEAKVAKKPPRKVATSRRGDWRQLPAEDRELVKAMSTAEIAAVYAVSDRTARDWAARAKNGNGKDKVK